METHLPDCLIARPDDAAWRPPLDEFDLAVRLETEGITDEVARSVHGYRGTLDMAACCFDSVAIANSMKTAAGEAAEPGWRAWLRGTVFALPMLLCALSMMTLGVSLWGGDLSADLASAVAIATVASLVITGGFVQAMSRRAMFYLGAANVAAAAALARAWAMAGAGTVLLAAVAGLAANLVFAWLPGMLALHTAAFFVLLGCLWLGCGGLYIVNRAAWIAGATLAGIAVVALLNRGLGWALPASQLAGVAAAVGITMTGTLSWFRARLTAAVPGSFVAPAREIYLAAPYFAYGALYYLFLFADRLIAWTAHTNAAALPLQFRGDYETALDLAMAAFVLQMGWVHASLAGFHRTVAQVQSQLPAGHYEQFNRALSEFYWWRLARVAAFGFASSGLVFFVVSRFGLLPFANMTPVLLIALVAYPMVVAGLWNTSLLFALNQPLMVLAPVSLGAAASLACGYLLSRMGAYDAAVIGFLIGAFMFSALSCVPVLQSFRKLDGHYYASAL
jgi:hypothetical protein